MVYVCGGEKSRGKKKRNVWMIERKKQRKNNIKKKKEMTI